MVIYINKLKENGKLYLQVRYFNNLFYVIEITMKNALITKILNEIITIC